MNTTKKSPHIPLPVLLPLALAALGVGIVVSTGWSGLLLQTLSQFTLSSDSIANGLTSDLTVGLWATVVGTGLTLCGVWCAALEWRRAQPPLPRAFRSTLWGAEFIGISLACLLWVTLLPFAGWLCASALSLALACRSAKSGWLESFALIILLVGGLYFGVEVLLNSPLPAGMWEMGDFYTKPAAPLFSLPDNAPLYSYDACGLYA